MGNVIQEWFDAGKPYDAGVALFEHYGRNKLLLRNFKRLQNASNEKKLEYELGKFLPKDTKTAESAKSDIFIPKEEKKAESAKSDINLDIVIEEQIKDYEGKQLELVKQLPEELISVLLRANLKWKENCILKLKLNALPDEAENEALKLQLQIDANWKENQLCWKQIDYYLQHKILPKEPKSQFDNLTAPELVKRQQYHFQNISKLKKRLKDNRIALGNTDSVKVKSKLERTIAKQESDLLAKEKELEIITNLVNGK